MAVFTPALLAACASDGPVGSSQASPTLAPASATPTPVVVEAETVAPTDSAGATEPTAAPDVSAQPEVALEPVQWARTNLGFVSAYVLVRGNSAAIVDTGTSGSAAAIGETLASLGLTYSDVEHVILTHNHSDHAGSISDVLSQAVNATAYAGEPDLGSIPVELTSLVGGEDIFGFEMVPTPGHTAGHMAVIDHQAGLVVAGDAIFTDQGAAIEGPERFFADVAQSRDSIRALAALSFNTLLVGHGDPIEGDAAQAVAALAATLA